MPNRASTLSRTKLIKLLASAPRTADANGSALDLRESDDVAIDFDVGAAADTLSGSTYIELELEESDDGSTWNDVPNSFLSTSVAGTNAGTVAKIVANAGANQMYSVAYLGKKRYIRPVVNITGTHSNGTPVGVFGRRARNRFIPVA